MKKLLFLLIPTVLLVSWIDLPTETITMNDPIIGTWAFEKIYYVYPDGIKKEAELNKCTQKVRHIYKSDGSLLYLIHSPSRNSDECIKKDDDFWTGKWKKLSDKNYLLNHIQTFISGDTKKSNKHSDSTQIYEFSNSNNTLTVNINYDRDGYLMSPEVKAIGKIHVFKRMK